jgi:hypothetical protein
MDVTAFRSRILFHLFSSESPMNTENMNTETEKNINQALDWLQKTGGQIQDFATEQAPLYCREVVALHMAKGVCLAIAGTLVAILAVFLWRRATAMIAERDSSYSDHGIGHWVISIIAAVLSLILLGHGAYFITRAKIAPRVVIVENLQRLQ